MAKKESPFYRSLYFYAAAPDAIVMMLLDDQSTIIGTRAEHNGRTDAHLLKVPAAAPRQGAVLEVTAPGYLPFRNRGIYDPVGSLEHGPHFVLDDVHLAPAPVTPPEPLPPDPNVDPFTIICAVQDAGAFDLATKEGCGKFTEAACEALHLEQSALWGHIRKNPGQNQWNEHAVDAVQLLQDAGTTPAGIYDIILSCESPDAEPAFTFKGPPDLALWFYPAAPAA